MPEKLLLSGFSSSTPIIVGVSGGADSLCLLGMLLEAGYSLVIAAHFNHKLRAEADADEQHVRAISAQMGVPFITASADVKAYADENRLSIEEAARHLRYGFLFAAAREQGAQAVAVAHTADDQVETVLMHFVQGAGLAGLKGMQPSAILPVFDPDIPLIRPLLGLWRPETESYCNEHGLPYVVDATNADQAYFRNRLRHSLIPELESYNPQFKQALFRSAQVLQGDFDLLAEAIDAAWNNSVVEAGSEFVSFKHIELESFSPAMRRNLFRRASFILSQNARDVDFSVLTRASDFVEAPVTGQRFDLANNLFLFHENGLIYLTFDEASLPQDVYLQVKSEIALENGEFDLENNWILYVDEVEGEDLLEQAKHTEDSFTAWMDAGLTLGRLRVRTMHAGDRFQPLGMDGKTVKLQDFFVNAKVPRRIRKSWPLVVVGGEIAWVMGMRLAQPFRVTEKTRRAVRLQVMKK
jgi:tRNA(Ile)-lysidine synthase